MDRRVPGDEDRLAPHRRLTLPAQPNEGRALGRLALFSLLPFAALAVWARFVTPAPWETEILSAAALDAGWYGDVVRALNTLGNIPIWAGPVAALAVLSWLARGLRAGLLVAISTASDLVAFMVKAVVERTRPDTAAAEHLYGPDSFPSGHVVRAVALCAALVWVFAPAHLRLRLALFAGIVGGLVMGYARVALGVHWPTDALGGLLLGLGWFAVVGWLESRPAENVRRLPPGV